MAGTVKVTRKCYRRHGENSPQVLQLLEEDIEIQEPTDVLIQVHAVALNYRDANILNGTNPWPVLPGGVPCSDAAGEVIAIGRSVTRFVVGDRLGGEVDGVLATHVLFPEEKVVKVPEHLGWAEAACLPCAGLTAWNAHAYEGGLVAGKTVLIQGTGGVSLMALKLARVLGCKVIITSSSDSKLDKVRDLSTVGDISTINYAKNPEWNVEAVKINGGLGVDIVLENGGTSSLLQSIDATAKRGIISLVGYLGRQNPLDLDGLLSKLIEKTTTLRGVNVGSRLELEQLNRVVAANRMSVGDIIDRVFSFEQASEAFGYLWSATHIGKVVIELK